MTAAHFEVIPTGAACGAEIRGLDVAKPPSAETVAQLRRALAEHGVLLLRDADLDHGAQVALTESFAPCIDYPWTEMLGRQPEHGDGLAVVYLGHDPEAPEVGSLGHGPISWHSDLQFTATPWLYTFLYAIEPGRGSETEFASLSGAWRALPLRARLRLRFARGEHRKEGSDTSERHPLAPRHPVSGRRSLYVSPVYTRRLHGVDRKRRRQILADLIGHACDERFVWRHRWQPRDLLIWDNLCTAHRRLPFDLATRRLMRRSQPSIAIGGRSTG